ncbi:MAG: S8 family serine peptidase [Beijerinckiaceae bacterium]
MRLRSCRTLIVALAVVAASHAGPSAAQTFNSVPVGRPAGGGGGSGGSGGLATGVLIGAGIVAGGLLIGAATRPPPQTIDAPPPGEPEGPIRPVRRRFVPPNPGAEQVRSVRRTLPPRPGFTIPAADERRYVAGEILVSIKGQVTPARLRRLETRYGLAPLASAHIALLDLDVRRYRIGRGQNVPGAIGAMRGAPQFVAAIEPNFVYELQEDKQPQPAGDSIPAPAGGTIQAPAGGLPPDKPPQYAITALKLDAAHKISAGANVLVAVIDTGLDETNPEIEGTVADRFDAVGGEFVPLSHGTAMGGVIVAHKTLTGVAPQARLLAIRAFTNQNSGPNGTGFDILRGLDFAASHGARIVNMSFAGPEDALLRDALDAARKQGIIEIAAAGNAGPNSKPLYPAAQSGVIAVTATDASDKIFAKANRGAYVSVAAPGANVIAPGLGGAVQFTSGTSVAAAEVSGVAALLLQADGKASPDEIRKILSETAHRLAADQAGAGAGLVDAAAAVGATPH